MEVIIMTINIPDWCIIGKTVEVLMYNKNTGQREWFKEKIISYGVDGFFHQAYYCPVYYHKFSDYGKLVKE